MTKAQVDDYIVRTDRFVDSKAKIGIISKVNWKWDSERVCYGSGIHIPENHYRMATKDEINYYKATGERDTSRVPKKSIDNFSVI